MQNKNLTLLKNLIIEGKEDFQDLNNVEIIKANLLKKITLNVLITMSIEEKRNLGLKNIVEGVEIKPFKWRRVNKENASKLWKMIQEAGDDLQGKLPNHPNHPKGRNPYAHVAICVKSKFGSSYKDLPDNDFQKVVEYIDFLKKNPS